MENRINEPWVDSVKVLAFRYYQEGVAALGTGDIGVAINRGNLLLGMLAVVLAMEHNYLVGYIRHLVGDMEIFDNDKK